MTPDVSAPFDVVVLAGGLGTRLRPVVGGTPKILAPVMGVPFLDCLLVWLKSGGARRVIFALGHGAEAVRTVLSARVETGLDVVVSVEPFQMGTGGAVALAADQLLSDTVVVVNGDTWLDVSLADLVADHRRLGTDMSIVCTEVADVARFGGVEVNGDGRVVAFRERGGHSGAGLIHAGICVMSAARAQALPRDQVFSLEKDYFEPACRQGRQVGAICRPMATFIDIGTPDSYGVAPVILAGLVAQVGVDGLPR